MKTKISLMIISILLLAVAVAFAESKEDRKRIEDEKRMQAYERKEFAERFEKGMLLKGYDVYMKVSNQTLMIKWNSVDRPFVYQFANNRKSLDPLLEHGFLVVIFYNEFGDHWSITTPSGDIKYFSTKIK